jgi:hypothetical protein
LSIAVALVTVLLTATVLVPNPGAGIAVAASSLAVAFRDLPASVRAGDSLRVIVDAPGGSMCDGLITYRDNSTQTLTQIKEEDGRCRWDIVVPDATRRGEADIDVKVRRNTQESDLTATIDVGRRTDDVGLVLKKLPGAVRRNNDFSVRIEVPDKATCQGIITYENAKTQALDLRSEDNEQCRWDLTVPADVERGEARLSVTITQDGKPTTLLTSFDVSRGNDDPDVLVAFQDPVSTARRDGPLPIRVLVPDSATCKGDVSFRSADNVKLREIAGDGGICRWTINVPEDAKRGESKITVTVSDDGKDTSITAPVTIEEDTDDVDANFKDLPTTIKRGDDLEVRISAPDNATCRGELRFDDGGVSALDQQTVKKDRCLWNAKVPAYTPRGTLIVWALIDDHGVQTTLTGNVEVEGRDDEPISASWDTQLKDVQPGQSFDVSLSVAKGSTCVGQIDFAGGMQWTLGDKSEDESHCKWRVDVPNHVGAGKAKTKITVTKGKDTTTLTANFNVKTSGTTSTRTTAPTATATATKTATTAATATTVTTTPSPSPSPSQTPTTDTSTASAPPPPQITLPSETPTPSGTDATDLSGDSPAALSGAGLFASGFGR